MFPIITSDIWPFVAQLVSYNFIVLLSKPVGSLNRKYNSCEAGEENIKGWKGMLLQHFVCYMRLLIFLKLLKMWQSTYISLIKKLWTLWMLCSLCELNYCRSHASSYLCVHLWSIACLHVYFSNHAFYAFVQTFSTFSSNCVLA